MDRIIGDPLAGLGRDFQVQLITWDHADPQEPGNSWTGDTRRNSPERRNLILEQLDLKEEADRINGAFPPALNHEVASDVVAVLEQHQVQKRYVTENLDGHNKFFKCMFRLERPEPTYALNRDAHNRTLDIYFTDGAGTRLGDLTPIDPDAAIAALSPTIWLDPEHSVTPESAPLVVGSDVDTWGSRGVAGILLNTNAQNEALYTVFGATRSLRFPADSTKLSDSAGTQPTQVQNCTMSLMFKTGTSVSSQANLIRHSIFDVYVKSGKIKFKDPSDPDQNQSEVTCDLDVAIATAYRLTCVRTTTTPANTYTLELLTLDGPNAGTLQTDTQTFTPVANLPDDYTFEAGGQYSEGYEISHYVEVPGVTTAIKTAIHDYMAAKWAGTVTYVAGTHASFFAELVGLEGALWIARRLRAAAAHPPQQRERPMRKA